MEKDNYSNPNPNCCYSITASGVVFKKTPYTFLGDNIYSKPDKNIANISSNVSSNISPSDECDLKNTYFDCCGQLRDSLPLDQYYQMNNIPRPLN
jgi:hypothetical protein